MAGAASAVLVFGRWGHEGRLLRREVTEEQMVVGFDLKLSVDVE